MTDDPLKNELENLRGELVDAPTLEKSKKSNVKKFVKTKPSPWILRSIIIVVSVIIVVEAFLFVQMRKESLQVNVSDPPPAVSFPTPEVYSEAIPQVEEASADDYVPEPTEIPLPPELEELDISYEDNE